MSNCRVHIIYIENITQVREFLCTSRTFSYSWDGVFCTIFRRNTPISKVRVFVGCKIIISPSSKSPIKVTVVEPPLYVALRKIWSYGFFNALKLSSLENLMRAVDNYNAEGITYARILCGDNAAFAYRADRSFTYNIPFRWWIDENKFTTKEVYALLKAGANISPQQMQKTVS